MPNEITNLETKKIFTDENVNRKHNYTDLIEHGFESGAPPNLKKVESPPTDEEEVNGASGTLSIFLLNPKSSDGASALVSFDGAALSKPNTGPVLVDSFN
jgi:hypothetical protein